MTPPPLGRRPTCERRRDEIAALRREVRALRQQLRGRGVPVEPAPVQRADTQRQLADSLRNYQLWLAGLHGHLDSHTASHPLASPLSVPIHLPADAAARLATLRQLLPLKLSLAQQLIQQRSGSLDLSRAFSSIQQVQDPANRDVYEVQFVVQPFPRVASVQRVFEAMKFWMAHVEICLTEHLGDLTLREDEAVGEDPGAADDDGGYVSQRRMLSTLPTGVVLEFNVVVCRRYDRERNVAVLAIQSVHSDARHPYHPDSCVQQRMLGAMVIAQPPGGGAVTLTRWMRVRVPPRATNEETTAGEGVARWMQVLQRVLRERLGDAID